MGDRDAKRQRGARRPRAQSDDMDDLLGAAGVDARDDGREDDDDRGRAIDGDDDDDDDGTARRGDDDGGAGTAGRGDRGDGGRGDGVRGVVRAGKSAGDERGEGDGAADEAKRVRAGQVRGHLGARVRRGRVVEK